MKLIYEGKEFNFEESVNGFGFLKNVNPSIIKESLNYVLNGKNYDMASPITQDGEISFITKDKKEAFEILNHSCSHLMAEAILSLWPNAKLGFGPAIEDGYYYDVDLGDYQLKVEDFPKIEAAMKSFSKKDEKFVRRVVSKDEAKEIFKDNPYKLELIEGINEDISIYTQGNFTDLCYGTHVPSTSYIKNFKLLNIAGAYWRGDVKNKQLTRIYGISFFNQQDLDDYLNLLEERKKRDHRRLGKELGLFMMSEYGPGFPFWLPNGMTLRRELENFWYDFHEKNGYVFCKTPTMLSKELWLTSGHWANYKDNMYLSIVDEKEFAIKPMNCPGGMLIYKNVLHSYKDLPLRLGELGLVHRHEASGALNGLFRVRNFTQDDAHIFIRKDQLIDEIGRLLKIYDEIYTIFGLSYHIELSTRPENKYIGDIEIWNESEKILEEACRASNREFKINPGDGAFYGPKLDFKLKDSMNRIWQCGTIQLDMNLPERFDLTYVDERGEKVRPIMLHRALLGSIERFIGIITEHFGGGFPTWLAPDQVVVLPVNNEYHLDYAKHVVEKLKDLGIRAKLDDSNEKLGYRLRNAQIKKIPYSLVIGDKEVANNGVTYRLYSQQEQKPLSLEEFVKLIQEDIKSKKLPKDRK